MKTTSRKTIWRAILAAGLACAAAPAGAATIKIGVIITLTGPNSGAGLPEGRAVGLMPKTIGADTIQYIVLDDAGNPTKTTQDAKQLFADDKVDALIGPSGSPNTVAIEDLINQYQVPTITMAGAGIVVQPIAQRQWIFKVPPSNESQITPIADYMLAHNQHTIALISFNDAYGESYVKSELPIFAAKGIKVVSTQWFVRSDTSVSGQALAIVAAGPDAVLVNASNAPAVLPEATLRQLGFQSTIYQTAGVANQDFVKIGGPAVEGTVIAATPVVVADQLPASDPNKQAAMDFVAAYGAVMPSDPHDLFGAFGWDAAKRILAAIPAARAAAEPGTPEFRTALRNGIEAEHLPGANGLFAPSPTDHTGLTASAIRLMVIKNGKFVLLQ
jgi:branched-chain amino acid transport system substrate-binding protein